jgi:hypothetical protein
MKLSSKLEEYRIIHGKYSSSKGEPYGAFFLPGPCGAPLTIIASDGDMPPEDPLGAWEHVSVSIDRRLPNWIEMCFVKDLFWAPEECVVQYHPPRSEYVNNFANCLHLWRPRNVAIPMPPSILVGAKDVGIIKSEADVRAIEAAAAAALEVKS